MDLSSLPKRDNSRSPRLQILKIELRGSTVESSRGSAVMGKIRSRYVVRT